MAVAICPSCEGQVSLLDPVEMGQRVRCLHCSEELEVIDTDPIELDWAYDDEDWDDDLDDDEDEDIL
jgi:lysine biosynthesis protein LysW